MIQSYVKTCYQTLCNYYVLSMPHWDNYAHFSMHLIYFIESNSQNKHIVQQRFNELINTWER